MRILGNSTEQEMVATFLCAEINSDRWREKILELLHRSGLDRQIVDMPDLQNHEENACRVQILGSVRGYGQRRSLFEQYPDPQHVRWKRAILDIEDLARVRYINYSYWNELSGGTRLANVAAENIRRNIQSCNVPNDGFWKAVRALEEGVHFPELILVASNDTDPMNITVPLTVLEGHVRLTAYLLAPNYATKGVVVLVGTAPEFAHW